MSSSHGITDKDLTCLLNGPFGILVPILFDWELGKHSLMGRMLSDDAYKARHDGEVFPVAKRGQPSTVTPLVMMLRLAYVPRWRQNTPPN